LHQERSRARRSPIRLLYLDLDRKGFDIPVLADARQLLRQLGHPLSRRQHRIPDEPEPPRRSPRRCFEVGRQTPAS
jgi:hypothetical protein